MPQNDRAYRESLGEGLKHVLRLAIPLVWACVLMNVICICSRGYNLGQARPKQRYHNDDLHNAHILSLAAMRHALMQVIISAPRQNPFDIPHKGAEWP